VQVAARPLVALALVAAVAAAFVTLRPRDAHPLPSTAVRYDAVDARRAFAAQDVALTVRSRQRWATELGDAASTVEVTVLGEPDAVRRAGFHDLERGRDCTVGGHLALRWRGNVRAIVNCDLVRDDRAWIVRVDRALAALVQSSSR
jgi:hypothetical protein